MSPSPAPPSAPRGTTTRTVSRCSCGTIRETVLPRRRTPTTWRTPRSRTFATRPSLRPSSRWCAGSLGEDRGGDDRRPEPVPVADRGLGDVAGDDDLVAHPPDVLALVVARARVELDAEDGREHRRRQVLGVVARLVV